MSPVESRTHPTQPTGPVRQFAMRFSSTPRGARLARRLVSHRLDEWGLPYDGEVNETVTLLVAELASNAVRHGHVPGRDFHLRLTVDLRAVRIDVTDARAEALPVRSTPGEGVVSLGGRGLWLVTELATSWGWSPRVDGPGKTVWAECVLPNSSRLSGA